MVPCQNRNLSLSTRTAKISATSRLFVAVPVECDFSGVQQRLILKGNFSIPKEFHITLKFLGEADKHKVIEHLRGINFRPFKVTLKSLGMFKSVLWAGVFGDEIYTLAHSVRLSLNDFMKDEFPYRPHCTIARYKPSREIESNVKRLIEDYNSVEFCTQNVKSFVLYESILTKDGLIHVVVENFNCCIPHK